MILNVYCNVWCTLEMENLQPLVTADPSVSYTICEENSDEKFTPLIRKNKGIFKDVSGMKGR